MAILLCRALHEGTALECLARRAQLPLFAMTRSRLRSPETPSGALSAYMLLLGVDGVV